MTVQLDFNLIIINFNLNSHVGQVSILLVLMHSFEVRRINNVNMLSFLCICIFKNFVIML